MWYWQQDGAGPHSIKPTEIGKLTLSKIHEYTNNIVDWPPYSPDLSPIENVWSYAERKLWREYTWHDSASFTTALMACWKEVQKDSGLIRSLMASVDRRKNSSDAKDKGGRIQQVLDTKGGPTTY